MRSVQTTRRTARRRRLGCHCERNHGSFSGRTAQHLQDDGEPLGADETLARVRQSHPRQIDAAGTRTRIDHPADRLFVPLGLRVGSTRVDRAARENHRRGDPAHQSWPQSGRLERRRTGCSWLATDELHADAHVSDATWQGLARHFNTQQLMDIVFTVGQYNLVSMALNSFGVQADPGLPGFDI